MSRLRTPRLLQRALAAPFASFGRQRSYGYTFFQKLTNGTHQGAFRLTALRTEAAQ